MTTRNIQIALLAVLVIAFISCGKKQTTISTEQQIQINNSLQQIVTDEVQQQSVREDPNEKIPENMSPKFVTNITKVMQSIIDGNSDALASVTSFPIWRPYPERQITNATDLKAVFNILFDDSIRQDLKHYSVKDWEQMGWRGYMLNDGQYFWTDDNGMLSAINYESTNLKEYRNTLTEEESQSLDESNQWCTIDCLLSLDGTTFLRLEKNEDKVQRLHVFTHDKEESKQHMVFNGTMELQGSCGNNVYWYACRDGLINVWINSPSCLDSEINFGAYFPDTWTLPANLRGKTLPCKRSLWRDVKKWW